MNAKIEFLDFILDKPKVKCVRINCPQKKAKKLGYILHLNYDLIDQNYFLDLIDFEYDNAFKNDAYLEGSIIWFEDLSWASRKEDVTIGEYWEYHSMPIIPDNFNTRHYY